MAGFPLFNQHHADEAVTLYWIEKLMLLPGRTVFAAVERLERFHKEPNVTMADFMRAAQIAAADAAAVGVRMLPPQNVVSGERASYFARWFRIMTGQRVEPPSSIAERQILAERSAQLKNADPASEPVWPADSLNRLTVETARVLASSEISENPEK